MKTTLRYLILAALLGALSVAVLQATRSCPASPAPPVALRSAEVSVIGYKRWVRVNPKPHPVISSLAYLCRNLTPQETAEVAADPHKDKFVTVYINKVAQQAMLHQKKPTFPQGSLIVKEKLPTADSTSPELLTVMFKRENGYNPTGGDWEYLVFDGTATQVQARGKLQKCQSCHEKWKGTGYVSRAYLPNATRRTLK